MRKSFPARTSETAPYPRRWRASAIAFPWGSRTPGLSMTFTRTLIVDSSSTLDPVRGRIVPGHRERRVRSHLVERLAKDALGERARVVLPRHMERDHRNRP